MCTGGDAALWTTVYKKDLGSNPSGLHSSFSFLKKSNKITLRNTVYMLSYDSHSFLNLRGCYPLMKK